MAMNGNDMGDAIRAALLAEGYGEDGDDMRDILRAVGGAIVDYIQANAVVPSGISVSVNTMTGEGATDGAGTVQ